MPEQMKGCTNVGMADRLVTVSAGLYEFGAAGSIARLTQL